MVKVSKGRVTKRGRPAKHVNISVSITKPVACTSSQSDNKETKTIARLDESLVPFQPRNLLDLPVELFELILSYCSYDEVAKLRMVNKTFDQVCQRLLNRGFIKVDKYHQMCYKKFKGQLPRRESERRNHPLARHCDVLSAIETRLSLLGMTYNKYIDTNLCCFIPGKVIDEIYLVLRFIQNNQNPPRVHELLQELRDISSMAMEYFEEKIAPTLKSKLIPPSTGLSISLSPSPSSPPCRISGISTPSTTIISRPSNSESAAKQLLMSVNMLKKEVTEMKNHQKQTEASNKKVIDGYNKKFKEMEKMMLELNQQNVEQKAQIEELKKWYNEDGTKVNIEDDSESSKIVKPKKDKTRLETQLRKNVPKRINSGTEIPMLKIVTQRISTRIRKKDANEQVNKQFKEVTEPKRKRAKK